MSVLRPPQIASLQKTVRHLEVEREQLNQNLKDQRELSDKLSVSLADMQEEIIKQSNGKPPKSKTPISLF